MKKSKFSEKLNLNKKMVSKLNSNEIVGRGPTFFFTCDIRYICALPPKVTDNCAPSQGCVPPTVETCPTLYVTC